MNKAALILMLWFVYILCIFNHWRPLQIRSMKKNHMKSQVRRWKVSSVWSQRKLDT